MAPKKPRLIAFRCGWALLVSGLSGATQGGAQSAGSIAALESPFTFCSRVGEDDRLGGATSSAALDTLEPYLHEALGFARDTSVPPNEIFWRCMEGKVYVCARGANIPCDSKADRSKLNAGAVDYCRENPNAAEVPAYATGHRTVYRWKCIEGRAERDPVVIAMDRRGFRTDIWHVVVR